jgi:hypothetical protein
MKKMQEKSKEIQIYKMKHNSPSNQVVWMANTKFETQEDSNQNTRFLNGKKHTPPETNAIKQAPPQTKANQTKCQTQSKTPTPLEVENPRFYQLSLNKPQDKHRPLKQQRKSMHKWPWHKCHNSENNYQRSQAQIICRPQTRKAHWTSSTTGIV